jgi:hypothetical protein
LDPTRTSPFACAANLASRPIPMSNKYVVSAGELKIHLGLIFKKIGPFVFALITLLALLNYVHGCKLSTRIFEKMMLH